MSYPADFWEWDENRRNAYFADEARRVRDAGKGGQWPQPKRLPSGLLPVAPFDSAFLPDCLRAWVMDISDRLHCPPDYVAIPAVVALGSVLGRKLAIAPQMYTDWREVPNFWGCIIGRPGAMKSPAMGEVLKPLHRLEAQARVDYDVARHQYAKQAAVYKIARDEAAQRARKMLASGQDPSSAFDFDEPKEPKAKRYVVSDTSYEALGEILADNPYGVLAFRDELVSLLKGLDREEHAAARGFFLTAWNGTGSYSFDRIVRGRTHIEAACLSLLGSTQPGRIAEYMRRAVAGGAGDDGLIQRFSLLVWPDQSPEWKEADRPANSDARNAAWGAFERLATLEPDSVGATCDDFPELPCLRFDGSAHKLFRDWRAALEKRIRATDLSPALESHLAKYRKLVPAVALINHIADGQTGPISQVAVLRSLAFADYLETHARRAYAAGNEAETAAAKAIWSRIRKGELADGFTARDIHQKDWANLTDREQVQAGLNLLADLDWLSPRTIPTGGRSRTVYKANPRALA